MDAGATEPSKAKLALHAKRSSSVIVHRVGPESTDRFMEMQDEFTAAATKFPGYQSTDVFPPANPGKDPWVVLMHFDTPTLMNAWIESPERLQLVDRLNRDVGNFELRVLPEGFAPWFAGLAESPPAGWKMAMSVVFALFPTVMILSILTGSITRPLGFAFGMLIGNILSVSILQWGVMPILTSILRPWYAAKGSRSVLGAVAVAASLLLIATGFHVLLRQ